MGIILAFHPQSRILLARQDGPVANKPIHQKKKTNILPQQNSTWAARNALYLQSTSISISLSPLSVPQLMCRPGPLSRLLLLSPQCLHGHLSPWGPHVTANFIFLSVSVVHTCNHCAKKEIEAQKLKPAEDHSSDVVITSEVNIFWYAKNLKHHILSYKRFK